MWEWIVRYWVEVLFGLVAAGLGVVAKKFWSLYQNEKKRQKELDMSKCYQAVKSDIDNVLIEVKAKDREIDDRIERVHKDSVTHDDAIRADIKEVVDYIETLKTGVLSVQGSHFRQQCKEILDSGREISVDEFEQLELDHNVYNSLGGNHLGDALFTAVELKFKAQLKKAKSM